MLWAYGVQTCIQRRDDLLPRTLASLKAAGWEAPRLFVDGCDDSKAWRARFGLEVTCHYPPIRTFGNWILALGELFIREPRADRYLLTQDDWVGYRNLRSYLEACPLKPRTYWNLYTFPQNAKLARDKGVTHGWFESNQRGKGAVALVFDRDAVFTLLTHQKMIERPLTPGRGLTNVDGGVMNTLKTVGYKELCHLPSLVQHTGLRTSMKEFDRRHPPQPLADTFRGEDFDALDLLHEVPTVRPSAAAYDGFPEPLRSSLIADWQNEASAIRRAIEGDLARLQARPDARQRQRLHAAIADYRQRLARIERNEPPYFTAERMAEGAVR